MQPLCGRLLQPGSGALLHAKGLLASSHVFSLGSELDELRVDKLDLPHPSIILHSRFEDEFWCLSSISAQFPGLLLGGVGVGSVSAEGSPKACVVCFPVMNVGSIHCSY